MGAGQHSDRKLNLEFVHRAPGFDIFSNIQLVGTSYDCRWHNSTENPV